MLVKARKWKQTNLGAYLASRVGKLRREREVSGYNT